MPHIHLSMYPGRDKETKQKVAKAITDSVVASLGVDKSVVSVSIEEVEPQNWESHISDYNIEEI